MSAEATPSVTSLDYLSQRALTGDAGAEAELFNALRVRFLVIAKRRVREDSVEDVVQDALRIIHEKHQQRKPERGFLVCHRSPEQSN